MQGWRLLGLKPSITGEEEEEEEVEEQVFELS